MQDPGGVVPFGDSERRFSAVDEPAFGGIRGDGGVFGFGLAFVMHGAGWCFLFQREIEIPQYLERTLGDFK